MIKQQDTRTLLCRLTRRSDSVPDNLQRLPLGCVCKTLTRKSNTLRPSMSNVRQMCPWQSNQSNIRTQRLEEGEGGREGKGGAKGGKGRWEEGRTDKGEKRRRGLGIITFNTSQINSSPTIHNFPPSNAHVPTQLHTCTSSHSPLSLKLTLAHHPQCLGSVPRP